MNPSSLFSVINYEENVGIHNGWIVEEKRDIDTNGISQVVDTKISSEVVHIAMALARWYIQANGISQVMNRNWHR